MTDPHRPEQPQRDPALDAAWRAYSIETPPPALDAKILAAAHREARSRPRAVGDDGDTLAEAREPSRWWWGLAAAATIGAIAFGIVQLAPPLAPGEPMTASDVPQETAKRNAAPPPQQAAAPPTLPAETPQAARPAPVPSKPDAKPAPAPASPAVPKAAAPSRQDATGSLPAQQAPISGKSERSQQKLENDRMGKREMKALAPAPDPQASRAADADAAASRDRAAPRPFPAAAPAPVIAPPTYAPPPSPAPPPQAATPASVAPQATLQAPAPPRAERTARAFEGTPPPAGAAAPALLPAAEHVKRIEALLAAGNAEEAARELQRFRAAYPDADHRLPANLRPWAAGIPTKP